MTTHIDAPPVVDPIVAGLTGPGGEFELREEDVLGAPMQVMKNRRTAVGELLAESVAWGDRDYIITMDRSVTFAEHAAAAYSLATALRDEYGVGKGDRVAILGANSIEWVTAFWATQVLGAVAVGLNGWWAVPEIEYGISHSSPTVMIVDAKRADRLEGVDTTGIGVIIMESDLPRLVSEHRDATVPRVAMDEDDPAVILYTSGTTGRPKGVLHSHRNILAVVDYLRFSDARVAEATGEHRVRGAAGDRRYLLTSPLFHIASLHNLVIPRLATGNAVIMHEGPFRAEAILTLIDREKVTNWGAVPTMVSRLLDHEGLAEYDLSSLTTFALASAPSSPAFQQRVREKLPFARNSLVNSYGLTECSTALAAASNADLTRDPGSLGRPVLMVQMEIRAADGTRAPDGEVGEVCTRSPFVMLRYWDDPGATAAAITPDRWLRTGDRGLVEDGVLRLVGRRSDLILRGGENIYPVEIEQILDEHPVVRESAVIGIDHPDLGQEVAAVVVVEAAASISESELADYTRERLAYFKVPTRWTIEENPLPRNATGKLLRRQIVVD